MELENKLISVIVPIYNAMPYLKDSVKSICNQSYRNIEIILVDDGSTDGSGIYCDDISEKDARVKVIHEENAGIVSARQIGICHSTGKYLTFVDADDEIELDQIERLHEEIVRNEPDIILFGLVEENYETVTKKGNCFNSGFYDRRQIEDRILPALICGSNFFSFNILPNLVCKCIRREWLNSCRYKINPKVIYGEDADISYQILPQAHSLSILDLYTYHYKIRRGTMVSKPISNLQIEELKNDIASTWRRIGIYESIEKQLDKYITFVSLVKSPTTVMDTLKLENTKLAVYGAGGFGRAFNACFGERNVLWVDKNYLKYQSYEMNVNPILTLLECESRYDAIFIAIVDEKLCKKIVAELRSMGLVKQIVYLGYDERLIYYYC